MADTNQLRVPEDSDLPCRLCNRRYLKAEAHWFCSFCRRSDERAQCPEECPACIAMVEEEWRRKALEISEIKKIYNGRTKVRAPSSYLFNKNRRKGSKTKHATPIKKPKVDVVKPREPSPATPETQLMPISSYSLRLKDFESFFYQDLNPVVPDSLVEKGFVLPEISRELRDRFEVTKSELVRLLASSSICYQLSKNRSQFCDENNEIFNASSDGIVSLFASLIKFKANALGKAVFDIRRALLSQVVCDDPEVISQMIYGPINPKESFFGNIDILKEAVAVDKNNVLRRVYEPTQTEEEEEFSSDEHEEDIAEGSSNFSDISV